MKRKKSIFGVKDVLIDSVAASIGTLVYLGFSRIKRKVMRV